MPQVLKDCPVCGSELSVTRLHCPACDTTIEGHFEQGRFANLTADQWEFLEAFIRVEGKLKHMEPILGLSYPTIRNRLHEIIRTLGYEPGPVVTPPDAETRREILERLDRGEITAEEAMRLLNGEEE